MGGSSILVAKVFSKRRRTMAPSKFSIVGLEMRPIVYLASARPSCSFDELFFVSQSQTNPPNTKYDLQLYQKYAETWNSNSAGPCPLSSLILRRYQSRHLRRCHNFYSCECVAVMHSTLMATTRNVAAGTQRLRQPFQNRHGC